MVKSFANNIENLIVGTDRGQVKVFAKPPHLSTETPLDSFNAHLGEVTNILVSADGRYVFSAGQDGTVFVYSVTEYANEHTVLKSDVVVPSIKDEQVKTD